MDGWMLWGALSGWSHLELPLWECCKCVKFFNNTICICMPCISLIRICKSQVVLNFISFYNMKSLLFFNIIPKAERLHPSFKICQNLTHGWICLKYNNGIFFSLPYCHIEWAQLLNSLHKSPKWVKNIWELWACSRVKFHWHSSWCEKSPDLISPLY